MKKITISILAVMIFIPAAVFAYEQQIDVAKAYKDSYKYEKMANYKDAYRVLIPVYKKYPKTYTINLRLGWLSYLLRKYKDAETYYQQSEKVLPYSLENKNGLAMVYLAKEEWVKAEEKCSHVLKTDYYNYYGNLYLIYSYKAQKKFSAAESVARKMLVIYPTDTRFLDELGISLYAQDKKKEAAVTFDSVLILDPENITAKKYKNQK